MNKAFYPEELSESETRYLFSYLQERNQRFSDHLNTACSSKTLATKWHRSNAFNYVSRMGIEMKPLGLLLCCGLTGGEERETLGMNAAAALELFHVWSMVHDDIIDKDEVRRDGPTIHHEFKSIGENIFKLNQKDAEHYGLSVGILAGDIVLSKSFDLLMNYYNTSSLDPSVTTSIIKFFLHEVVDGFLTGEMMDIEFTKLLPTDILPNDLLSMYSQRVGQSYRFIGRAGASIGLNSTKFNKHQFYLLEEITYHCGMAYQLSNELHRYISMLHKQFRLSDIQNNIAFSYALNSTSASDKHELLNALAEEGEALILPKVKAILSQDHILAFVRSLINKHLSIALQNLENMPDSQYRNIIGLWARHVSLSGRKS